MIERPERTVILCDGGLASAVALAAAREARVRADGGGGAPAAVWINAGVDDDAPLRDKAARAMASAMGCAVIGPDAAVADASASGADRSILLLIAGTASCAAGRPEIVWPVTLDRYEGASMTDRADDTADMAREIDRAVLVTRLLSLDASDHGHVSVNISCPFVEMPDRGLAELAVDLAAPADRCWWVGQTSVAARRERARWEGLLRASGHAAL